jgi:hypothetical protein
MRVSFLFVAGLTLAACSSLSMASPGSYSDAPSITHRLAPANAKGDHLTLRFENANSGFANLTIDAFSGSFKCVASVAPEYIYMEAGQSEKLDIQTRTDGACKDAAREVDFSLTDTTYHKHGAGWLEVRYSAQSGWTGKIIREFNDEFCADPPGFREGAHLEDNKLIKIFFC